MNDTILYPIDDMSTTSKSLSSFLDEQWSQHNALFMNNSDSYNALLLAVARVLPDAGGKIQELATNLQDYHKRYQDCYAALQTLATQIDTASQQMSQTDNTIAQGFK
jgi:hypothetical protein